MGKRQRRRERELQRLQDDEPLILEQQDVTVTAGAASASGAVSPDSEER